MTCAYVITKAEPFAEDSRMRNKSPIHYAGILQ